MWKSQNWFWLSNFLPLSFFCFFPWPGDRERGRAKKKKLNRNRKKQAEKTMKNQTNSCYTCKNQTEDNPQPRQPSTVGQRMPQSHLCPGSQDVPTGGCSHEQRGEAMPPTPVRNGTSRPEDSKSQYLYYLCVCIQESMNYNSLTVLKCTSLLLKDASWVPGSVTITE